MGVEVGANARDVVAGDGVGAVVFLSGTGHGVECA